MVWSRFGPADYLPHPEFRKGDWVAWTADVRDSEPEKLTQVGRGPFRVRQVHGYRRCNCRASQFEHKKSKHAPTCPGRRFRLEGIHFQLLRLEDAGGEPVRGYHRDWISAGNFTRVAGPGGRRRGGRSCHSP